jgi:predicted CoA-binding protein
MSKNVVVLGASHKPERYSYKAVGLLREKGYNPIPVHPRGNPVGGIPARISLNEVEEDVDTVSVYVNKNISGKMTDEIIALNPKRVIFNPGAENESLEKELEKNGIKAVEACTLVLLRTGQF